MSDRPVSRGSSYGQIFESPSPHKAERAALFTPARYISPEITKMDRLGRDSPGPKYLTQSTIGRDTQNVSFTKGRRSEGVLKSVSPGPAYPAKSTLGEQLTNHSSPSFSFSKMQRFALGDRRGAESPGPGANNSPSSISLKKGHSFGKDPRVTMEHTIYLSKLHNDVRGEDSPGPIYNPNYRVEGHMKETPYLTFPKDDRNLGVSEKSVRDSMPGPGAYDAYMNDSLVDTSKSYTFGSSDREDTRKIFISPDFSVDVIGRESPGPLYNPDINLVRPKYPVATMGIAEREVANPKPRVRARSPGPGHYNATIKRTGPAYTMSGREREVQGDYWSSPSKPRFHSKELAVENIGRFSPGPKYRASSTLGFAPKYTFGHDDREHPEVRYVSPEYKLYTHLGRESPGPTTYDVNTSSFRIKAHAARPSSRSEAKLANRKDKTKTTSPQKTNPSPMYYPGLQAVAKRATACRFGTGERFVNSESEACLIALQPGRDSPGPIYQPSYKSTEKRPAGIRMGALS